MKIYADFYHLSAGYIEGSVPPRFDTANKKLVSACGDRATIQIDARLNKDTLHSIAKTTAKERGYLAYRLLRGDGLLRATNYSDLIEV